MSAISPMISYLIGLVILGVLIYIAYALSRPAAVAGTSGGVTVDGHPQDAASGSSGSSAPAIAATAVPPVPVPMVKYIVVSKDTTGQNVVPPASRTFQIGEIKAFRADGSLLVASDYSDAVYNGEVNTGVALTYPAKNAIDGNVNTFTHTNGETSATSFHQMKLTLRDPAVISRVDVINRVDCCADRLAGAVIQLIAENGTVLKSMTLSSSATQTVSM